MKETPKEKKIHQNLMPGQLSIDGFLGADKRQYTDIISADQAELDKLDLTAKMIADRLEYFTEAAFESYAGSIVIDEKYEVDYDSFRGKLICPFGHSGVYRKGLITLKNLENSIEICWTPLNIHLIREHCFFEGKGSIHRLEPASLGKAIF
ncbi:MAG: hypothetical protein Q7J16_04725 [Candidatus Cloacimonadales bacterium]|nr:hypothetical protein [Candidatus Cloacimonadales bacterium]